MSDCFFLAADAVLDHQFSRPARLKNIDNQPKVLPLGSSFFNKSPILTTLSENTMVCLYNIFGGWVDDSGEKYNGSYTCSIQLVDRTSGWNPRSGFPMQGLLACSRDTSETSYMLTIPQVFVKSALLHSRSSSQQ